jgi:hypothetical protein
MITAPLKIPPVHVRHLSPSFQNNGQPKIKFVNPNSDNFDGNIRNAADLPYRMIKHNELRGATVVIAGSGPTLNDPDVLESIRIEQSKGAILVALKKAIKVLHDKGFKIDYAVSMDPGDHVACPERIYKAPGVKHILATSSDPKLFEYLDGEEIYLFHSACGLPNEVQLYQQLWATKSNVESDAWVAGGGYNVTNRAAAAFLFMGAKRLVFAGADSGWRDDESFYADGTPNRPGVDMCDKGLVDGKPWWTRPDMLASGVALAKLQKLYGEDKIVFLGDVMPAKLAKKDDEFLDNCVSFQK